MVDLPIFSRWVDAYIKVADDVNRSIVLTALHTKTPEVTEKEWLVWGKIDVSL